MGKYTRYQYHQQRLAERVWHEGFITGHEQFELCLVALYLRDVHGMPPRERRAALTRFLREQDKEYTASKWCLRLNAALKYAADKNRKLVEIERIPVYQSEMAFVDGLDVNEDVKRTVFAMMVQKKLDKISFEAQHGQPYAIFAYSNSDARLKALPRVAGIKRRRGFDFGRDVLFQMREQGLIEVMACKGTPLKLNFVDQFAEDGEVAVEVRDYEDLGIYWDYLHGGDIGFCTVCRTPFRCRKHGEKRKYCEEHLRGRVNQGARIDVACIDCGKVFTRSTHAAMQVRCHECQQEHRKQGRKQGRETAETPVS